MCCCIRMLECEYLCVVDLFQITRKYLHSYIQRIQVLYALWLLLLWNIVYCGADKWIYHYHFLILFLFFLETFEPQLKSFLLTWHNKFLVVKTTLNTRFTQISENSVGTSTLIQQKGHINRQNKKSITFGWWLICDNCYVC